MLCHILSGGACSQAFSTRNKRDVQAADLLGTLETRDEEENESSSTAHTYALTESKELES
jgi:hypothetical protein